MATETNVHPKYEVVFSLDNGERCPWMVYEKTTDQGMGEFSSREGAWKYIAYLDSLEA